MPYKIVKRGAGKYQVVKKDGGKVVGTTHSRTKARKMIEAIHADDGGK